MNTKMSPLVKLPNKAFAVVHLPNFHAQVISAYYKDYRHQAFAITEQAFGRHKTVVISCSKEALLVGVVTGSAIHEIDGEVLEKVKLVSRSKTLERNAHSDLMRAVDKITPVVNRLSENEYLLDITNTPFLRELGIEGAGNGLRLCLKKKLGFMDVAVGIAPSKICAQVVARSATPENTIVCNTPNEPEYLHAAVYFLPGLLDIEKEKLQKLGILRIGQLRNLGRGVLKKLFGKNGEWLLAASMGMDLGVVDAQKKNVVEEEVLEVDINDLDELFKVVLRVADRVFDKVQQRNRLAQKMVLNITYGDSQKAEARVDLPSPSNRLENTEMLRTVFLGAYTRRVAIRSVSIRVTKSQPDHGQLSLFDGEGHKTQKRTQAIQNIRKRFGFGAIENGNYFGVSKTVK